MPTCEKCGDAVKGRDVCYLITTSPKTKEKRILKVCKKCKYGDKR